MQTRNKPGTYQYTSAIGSRPEVVQVRRSAAELVAVFSGIEGHEEATEVPVAHMSGEFQSS